MSGPRVGRPASFRLVACYLVGSLVCFLLSALALVRAAPDLAHGWIWTPETLLAVHLLALGFLPFAVAGGALHILPTLLRASGEPRLGRLGLVGLCGGPFLAVGVARHEPALTWATVVLVAVGAVALVADLVVLAVRAPRDRLLLASRFGVGAASLHALLAFLLGPLLFAREGGTWLGIPHERLIAIHLHLAVLGWLTLLILTVGRTLAPMLALAPTERVRRLPLEELGLTAGLWLAVLGFALDRRALLAAGYALVLAAVVRFVAVVVRAARLNRLEAAEGPIAHFVAGAVFLAQAAVLAPLLLAGSPSLGDLTAYVLLLLLGWAAGVTLGHSGKLLALSAWTWWPPGPRPKQTAFYPRRSWLASAAAFAAGTELLVAAALAGSPATARAGAVALVVSAVAALHGATRTLAASSPALRPARSP